MRGSEFAELKAFTAVARHGSFARAAAELGVTASAMSQTIRTLERRLGASLLNRTTRAVSLTHAGARLFTRVQPAIEELAAAAGEVRAGGASVSGTVRIITPRVAYADHLEPLLPRFHRRNPDVVLDVTIDEGIHDIVARGYDIGVRLGEYLQEGVVAVRLGADLRQLAVASPAYLREHAQPRHPRELQRHACIGWRQPGAPSPYRWEFARGGRKLAVEVNGPLILNDRQLAVQAALAGMGIALWVEHRLRPFIESGQLVPLLTDWSPRYPGFFACYRRQPRVQPALQAFVEQLKAP